jgi:hypothetical protein
MRSDVETGQYVNPGNGGAQSLEQAKQARGQAARAYEAGNYDAATAYARQAEELARESATQSVGCSPPGAVKEIQGAWSDWTVKPIQGWSTFEITDYRTIRDARWASETQQIVDTLWLAVDLVMNLGDVMDAVSLLGNVHQELQTRPRGMTNVTVAEGIAQGLVEQAYSYVQAKAVEAIRKGTAKIDAKLAGVELDAFKVRLTGGWTADLYGRARNVDRFQCIDERWVYVGSRFDTEVETRNCKPAGDRTETIVVAQIDANKTVYLGWSSDLGGSVMTAADFLARIWAPRNGAMLGKLCD